MSHLISTRIDKIKERNFSKNKPDNAKEKLANLGTAIFRNRN